MSKKNVFAIHPGEFLAEMLSELASSQEEEALGRGSKDARVD